MPISFIEPPADADSFASPIQRLNQQQADFIANGDPLANVTPPTPAGASWGEAMGAHIGTSFIQDAANLAMQVANSFPTQPGFNPYKTIRETPDLANDPAVQALVNAGQFDHSDSVQQFYYDLATGRNFLDDTQTRSRTSWVNGLTTGGITMLGESAALLPLTPLFEAAGAGAGIARVARIAGTAAGVNLAIEKAHNLAQPASNAEGWSNELAALASGAFIGGTLGFLTSPTAVDGIKGYLPTSKLNQLRSDFDNMLKGPGAVSQFDPNLVHTNSQIATSSLADEIARGKELVERAIAEPPADNRVVSAIHSEGDETATLIDQLQAKYDAAGKTLQVVEHPDQWYHDLTNEVQRILNDPALNAEAKPGDFDAGIIDRAVSAVSSRYANLASAVTPGGRIAQANLGRLQDVYRTLSGSAQTITVGSARDPFNFETGAAAENLKGIYDAAKDATIIDLRRIYTGAGKSGPITYGRATIPTRFGYKQYSAAVLDLLRAENAQAQGFPTVMPTNVSPVIRAGADRVRSFFSKMRDELEGAGMLEVGPKALAAEKAQTPVHAARITRVQDAIVKATANVEDARTAPGTIAGEVPLSKSDVDRDLATVIPPEILHPGTGSGQTIRPSVASQLERIVSGEDAGYSGDARMLALANLLDRTGELNANAGDRFTGIDPKTLQEGDRWKLDNHWQIEVVGAEGDRLMLHLFDSRRDIPIGGGESMGTAPYEVTVGLDKPLPANAGTLTRDGNALPITNRRLDSAQARLKRLNDQLPRAQARAAEHGEKVKTLEKIVAGQDRYLPRVYDVPEIMGSPTAFVEAMAAEFRRADSIVDGQRVIDPQRPLIPEVAEKISQVQLAAAAEAKRGTPLGDLSGLEPAAAVAERAKGLTEGDLPASLRDAYKAELDGWYQRNAQAVLEKLTEPKERHGVADAIAPGDPTKARSVTVSDSAVSRFLEPDLESIIHRYAATVGGRTAVRRAIQLNGSLWEGKTLADGRPIVDGSDLMQYLRETTGAMEKFAAVNAERTGNRKPWYAARALGKKIERDIGVPLAMIEGRNPVGADSGFFSAMSYMGRVALRLTLLNKLGSATWSHLSDIAPSSLGMLMNPSRLAMIPRALFHLKSLPTKDLEIMGLMFDGVSRTRALTDTDAMTTNYGFGEGVVRKWSAKIEHGSENLSDLMGRASMLSWTTDIKKRVGGGFVIGDLTDAARKMARVGRLVQGGTEEAAAMKRAGLSAYEAASANKLGINGERAALYERQLWEHGLNTKDESIRDLIRWDDFHGNAGFTKRFIKPNFGEWDTSKPEVRDLYDTLTSNLSAAVKRNLIVTPGAFDKPVMNQTVLGRIFNQLQSFQSAISNQRLRPMAQAPAGHQLWNLGSYLFFGGLIDAIQNDLSGRRTIDQTMDLWKKNPMGMVYASWRRSGLEGWMGRPLAIADALGIPFTPGNLLDNATSSTAGAHISGKDPLTMLGPLANDASQAVQLAGKLGRGEFDKKAAYMGWKLAPFQNLVWLRLLHRATGAPVIPETLIEDQRQRQEIRP